MSKRQNNRKNHATKNRQGKQEQKKEIIEKRVTYVDKCEEKKIQESATNKYTKKTEEQKPKAYKPINQVEKNPQDTRWNKNTKHQEKDEKIQRSTIQKKIQELPEEKQDFQPMLNLNKRHQHQNKRRQNYFINQTMLEEWKKYRIPSLQRQGRKTNENRTQKIQRKRMLDQQHPKEDQPEDSSPQQSSLNMPERQQQQTEDVLQKNYKKQHQIECILKTQRSEQNSSETSESHQERINPFHSLSQAQRTDFTSDKKYLNGIKIYNMDGFIIKNLLDFEKPPNNIKIHNTFKDSQTYVQNLTILFYYQVLSNYSKKLDLLVDQQKRIGKIQVKIHQYRDRVYVTPIDDEGYLKDNYNLMKEAMIHGSTVGILTFSQDFKYEYLQDGRAALCCLTKRGKEVQLKGIDDTNIPTKPIRFINLGASVSYKRQLQAITRASQSQFIGLIIGKQKNNFRQDRIRKDHYKGNQIFKIMNQIRKKAMYDILLAEEGLFIMQGPPGTGKTSIICDLVAAEYNFYKSFSIDSKIVICSDSNAAIKHVGTIIMEKGLVGISKMPKMVILTHISEANRNLLEISLSYISQRELLKNHGKDQCKTQSQLNLQKENLSEKLNKCRLLSRRGDELHEIRKGYQRVMNQLQEVSDFVSEHQEQYIQIMQKHLLQAEIVLGTLNSCGNQAYLKILAGMCNIGCLIIDEAGQTTQPSILIPFQLHAKKVVIVGDHKQFSPTTFSNNVKHTHYSRSMFQRFIQNGMRFYMLNTQYRMVRELSYFFNREFYEGKIKNCIIQERPDFYRKMKKNLVFYDITYGQDKKVKKSFMNEAELQAILVFLKKLIKEEKQMTIGIISPYKPQVKELRERIEELNLPSYIADNIEINTIDSFQGLQKDIIIISTVSSNNKGIVGHIKQQKRLNVALSRCKFGMFIFGNTETLRNHYLLRRYINYHENRQSLITVNSEVEMQSIINSNFKDL